MKSTNTLPVIVLKKVIHRKGEQLMLQFKYDGFIKNTLYKNNFKWSATYKGWYTAFNAKAISNLKVLLKYKAQFNLDSSILEDLNIKQIHISKENKTLVQIYAKYLKGKKYHKNKIETYSNVITDFISYIEDKPLIELTNKDVALFIKDTFAYRNINIERELINAIKQFKAFYPECGIDEIKLQSSY